MNENDYAKLNSYLNDIFNYMEDFDECLFLNLSSIYNISEYIYNSLNENEFEEEEVCNDLTLLDVIKYSKEIVKEIDEKYVDVLENAINSGEIDFNNLEDESYFLNLDDVGIININRSYNYQDVINLIHEFGHYLCNKGKKQTKLGYLLDEFIGKYFEIKATIFLCNHNYNEEEIKASYCIEYLMDNIYEFMNYYPLLLMYYNFGNIDFKTQKLFSKYFYNIDYEQFEDLCYDTLNLLEYINDEYKKKCNNDSINIEKEDLVVELSRIFSEDYRYILGTLLSFYPFDRSVVLDLIDNINSSKYENITFQELCKVLKIDLNDNSFIKTLESSIWYFINNNIKKVKKWSL